MRSGLTRRLGRVVALSIVGALAVAELGAAADFSADMITKGGSMSMNGKVFVSGKLIRTDATMGTIKQTTIVRGDKGLVWMVNHADKQYTETRRNASQMDPTSIERELKQRATAKKLGQAKINGFVCDKTLYTFKDKQQGTATTYVSRQLGWPVKIEMKSKRGGMTMELKNIKMGKQSASLFQLPAGYKKMQMPKGLPTLPAPKKK